MTMDTTEIQKRLDAMARAMGDKGLRLPQAQFSAKSGERTSVNLFWAKTPKSAWADNVQVVKGDTIPDQLDAADAWIAALPEPQAKANADYMRMVADAADFGSANNVPDEYVAPLRMNLKAMSENLIAGPK